MSSCTTKKKVMSIREVIDSFLLSCKVEGKSYGTIECYSDKLKGFLWYTRNFKWPDNIKAITTNHLREFLVYLRETPHRLRDAFAVNAVKIDDSGDGLRMLQEHLGHQSFNTTAKYRKVAGEELKSWYEKLWEKNNDSRTTQA